MLSVVAHTGQPIAPHDVWGAWNVDPFLIAGLTAVVLAYRRGVAGGLPRRERVRTWAFAGAMAALVVALVSPVEAMAGALASAHMVQHVLLIVVAAPLLALSAPSSAVLRGAPATARRASGWVARRVGGHRTAGVFGQPVLRWMVHVVTVWVWHASVLYDTAVQHEALHVLEHVLFVATAWWFWSAVIGGRRGAGALSRGAGVLLVFGMAMQSVLLALLLTFAREPWYGSYAVSTRAWGLEPLADQHLAGAIMWVPASPVYLGVALVLLVGWLHENA